MSNSILLAHGNSKTFGKVLVIGFFMNLILDPWFLYGGFGLPAMGIQGIAWATILIQAVGLSSAIVSIVGQNNGAGKTDRVRECIRICSRYGFILIGTASILLYLFAGPLVQIFTSDPEVIETGKNYVRIVTFIQWAYVSGFIYIGCLQALKRPMYGFAESVVRKIILPLLVFSIVVHVLELDLTGFWWSMVAINASMAIITIAYVRSVLRKLHI